MKFLVMSDSHGVPENVTRITNHYRDKVDLIFHTGDSEVLADDPSWNEVDFYVAGNCDFDPNYAEILVVDTPVGKVFMTHGHLHNVKLSKDQLVSAAKAEGAKYAFFGHTHVTYLNYINDMIVLNSGSVSYPRSRHGIKTFAILEIFDDYVHVDFIDDQFNIIESLSQDLPRP